MSLLLVALTLGMTFCHVMEMPGKLRLDAGTWLAGQQKLYVAFGTVGAVIEVLAILLTWPVAVQVRHCQPAFRCTVAAGGYVSAGLAVWFALVAPVNNVLSGWTPAILPSDWSSYRDRWETGHAIHAALIRGRLQCTGDRAVSGNSRRALHLQTVDNRAPKVQPL